MTWNWLDDIAWKMDDLLPPTLHRAAAAGLAQEVRRLLEEEAATENRFDRDDHEATEDTSRGSQLRPDYEKHLGNNRETEEMKEKQEFLNGKDVLERENEMDANGSTQYRLRETISNGPRKRNHNASSAVHVKDVDGRTALHAAVEAAGAGAAEAVQLLLNAGADVGARDLSGATPLHLASYWGHAAAAQHLLCAGADATEEWLADLSIMMQDARVGSASDARLGHDCLPLAALHLAAGAGHVGAIEVLLAGGADPNAVTTRGSTPLHLAVAGGHEHAMAVLLAAGASVEATDADGRSPLHTAAFTGRPAPLKMLLDQIQDKVAALNAGDAVGATPLHLAAGGGLSEVLRRFVRASDREDEDAMWKRPALKELQQQINEGAQEMVDLLLTAGAKHDSRDAAGAQPLHYAAMYGRTETMRTLLDAGADPQVRALLRPCPPPENEVCDALHMYPIKHAEGPIIGEGVTALHAAAAAPEESCTKAMSLLIERGANPEAVATGLQGNGRRPLHVAALLGRVSAIEALLEAGVSPEESDTSGRTPLHDAAARGHTLAVQTLLSAGASVNAVEVQSSTPLHLAASASANADSVVAALLASGAAANAVDKHEITALHRACLLGRVTVCRALLEAGASPSIVDARGRTPLHAVAAGGGDGGDGGEEAAQVARILINAGAEVNARDERGAAPLHRAVETGSTKVVRALLDSGADPEITWNFKFSKTAHCAENDGRPEILLHAIHASREKENRFVKHAYLESTGNEITIEKELDSNEADEAVEEIGLLASHIAAAHGHVNVLKILLRAGLSASGKKIQIKPNNISTSKRKSSGNIKKCSLDPLKEIGDDLSPVHNGIDANMTQSEQIDSLSYTESRNSNPKVSNSPVSTPSVSTSASGENEKFLLMESDVTPLHLAAAGSHEEAVRLILRLVMETEDSMEQGEVNGLIEKGGGAMQRIPSSSERMSLNGSGRKSSSGSDQRSSNGSGRRLSFWSTRGAPSIDNESTSLAKQQTRDGRTALHSAALRRDSAVVHALLEAEADATAEDTLGIAPGALADDPALRTILGCTQPSQRDSISRVATPIVEEADSVRTSRCCCVL